MRDLFDKKYGMFCSYSSTKINENNAVDTGQEKAHYYSWFPIIREPEDTLLGEYALVGKLLGLAIYNSAILDVSFPKCLYRKLLGTNAELEDLKELDPTMHHSLVQFINSREEEFESFGIENFSCLLESIDVSKHTMELKYQGSQIHLQLVDRHEWVSLYVDVLLNQSISHQFNAFKRDLMQFVQIVQWQHCFVQNRLKN